MRGDRAVYNTLSADEAKLIVVIRGFLDRGTADASGPADDPLRELIEVPLIQFISFLWRADPYVVKLNQRDDPVVTLFELQVLYAISEARGESEVTVDELLAWWLPQDLIETGRASLITIARLLNDFGMDQQSSDRLREQILETSFNRGKSKRIYGLDSPVSDPLNTKSTIQTLH